MQESELSIRSLAGEREVVERERWNLLKHVREESERCVQLAAQLGSKDAMLRQLQDELRQTKEDVRFSVSLIQFPCCYLLSHLFSNLAKLPPSSFLLNSSKILDLVVSHYWEIGPRKND
jgi:hypothetical protein